MKIVRNTKRCYGCRDCELICSFHHKKVFSPELSSIKVTTDMRTGLIQWSIDSTCDGCRGEERMMCVEYCPYNALEEVRVNG
jgi:Fe-S-cluster-containing hydrogenase component 2